MTTKELRSYFPITRISVFVGFIFWILGAVWQFVVSNPFKQGSSYVHRHFLWESMAYTKAYNEELGPVKHNDSQESSLFEDIDEDDTDGKDS